MQGEDFLVPLSGPSRDNRYSARSERANERGRLLDRGRESTAVLGAVAMATSGKRSDTLKSEHVSVLLINCLFVLSTEQQPKSQTPLSGVS